MTNEEDSSDLPGPARRNSMTGAASVFYGWSSSKLACSAVLRRLISKRIPTPHRQVDLQRAVSALLSRWHRILADYAREDLVFAGSPQYRQMYLCGSARGRHAWFCRNAWICPVCRGSMVIRTIRLFSARIAEHRQQSPFSPNMQMISSSYSVEHSVSDLPSAYTDMARRPPLIGATGLRRNGRAGLVITVPELKNHVPASRRTEIYFCDADDDLPPPNCDCVVQRYTYKSFSTVMADAFAFSPGLIYDSQTSAKQAVWRSVIPGLAKLVGDGQYARVRRCRAFGWLVTPVSEEASDR